MTIDQASRSQSQMDFYRPISDYGIIGDCRTAALVSSDGSIDWCCFPNFGDSSVFGRLLDAQRGGYFSIRPVGPFQSEQSYIEGANVLTVLFQTSDGAVRLTDFMPVPTAESQKRHIFPLRQIIRSLEGLSGVVEMEVEYEPRPSYAAREYRLELRSPYSAVMEGRGWHLHLLSGVPLTLDRNIGRSRFPLAAGQRVSLSLAYDEQAPAVFPATGQLASGLLSETVDFWKGWLGQCSYRGRYLGYIQRSALVLKLLEFAPSSAIIAAPTTSLPEKIGGVRNWDYRFCWLRDASMMLRALRDIGFTEEAEAFVGWLLHATRLTHPRFQVVYSVFGEPALPQRELEYLEGYRGSRPVQIGNQAASQYQLDIYGEVLDGVFQTDPGACASSSDVRRVISGAARFVSRHWQEPDNGIWEMQEKGQFTHSKVLCWLALERALDLLAKCRIPDKELRQWQKARDDIARVVAQEGYNQEVGAFVQRLGGQELDAAVLTFPILHWVDARAPRMLATVQAIREKLTANGLVYRYLADDGLPPGEGTFSVCTFWLAHCLALQGDIEGAREIFEGVLDCCNRLGLLSEEIDPNTHEALGNFPQALTHIGLINAAVAIQRAEEDYGSTSHALERSEGSP